MKRARAFGQVICVIIAAALLGLGLAWAEDVEVGGSMKVSGTLNLPATASATTGIIRLGAYNFIHAYGMANTFIGNGAGNQTATGGYDNTGIGHTALSSLTFGGWNTAVGALSLGSDTSGEDNTAVGTGTLLNNATGSMNTATGSQALRATTGSKNVALGAYAGYSANNNIAGSKNTYIGTQSGAGIPETTAVLTNAAAIGYKALVAQSNSLILGATGSDADAPAVYVGIGTTAPSQRLEVVGTVKATSFIGDMAGSTHLSDNAIYLRGDTNHALRWAGNTSPFASVNVDGPALYGYSGGVLGTTNGGQNIALQWDTSGNVDVTGNITYVTPKTRHWSITGEDFVPYTEGYTYAKSNGVLSNTVGIFTAPVHLPDGAAITKMTIYYLDNNATSSFWVFLIRFNMTASGFDFLSQIYSTDTSSGNFGALADTTINQPVVDNSIYAYKIYVNGMDGTENQRLRGVAIEYTVDKPLP